MRVVCAWCSLLLRDGDPAEVSHGICPSCQTRFEQDARHYTTAPIQDASGRVVAPPQTHYEPRPLGPWDRNA